MVTVPLQMKWVHRILSPKLGWVLDSDLVLVVTTCANRFRVPAADGPRNWFFPPSQMRAPIPPDPDGVAVAGPARRTFDHFEKTEIEKMIWVPHFFKTR